MQHNTAFYSPARPGPSSSRPTHTATYQQLPNLNKHRSLSAKLDLLHGCALAPKHAATAVDEPSPPRPSPQAHNRAATHAPARQLENECTLTSNELELRALACNARNHNLCTSTLSIRMCNASALCVLRHQPSLGCVWTWTACVTTTRPRRTRSARAGSSSGAAVSSRTAAQASAGVKCSSGGSGRLRQRQATAAGTAGAASMLLLPIHCCCPWCARAGPCAVVLPANPTKEMKAQWQQEARDK